MNKLITLILILFSISINGQALEGFITHEVAQDSLKVPSTPDLVGMTISLERILDNNDNYGYLIIGVPVRGDTLYNSYEITEKIGGITYERSIHIRAINILGDKLYFIYHPGKIESFELLFNHNGKYNYTTHYKGIFQ